MGTDSFHEEETQYEVFEYFLGAICKT